MFTERLAERQALASAVISTLSNSSVNTGNGMNMGVLRRARAFLHTGTLTGAASLDFSIQASATSGGSYSAITGLGTLPALTGITTDDGWFAIEISSDLLPAGKPWIRAIVTETATANAVVDLFIIGDESAYKPANAQTPALSTITFTNDVVAKV